jgi:pimeloyl-ACP methyl ester carboxylesterase
VANTTRRCRRRHPPGLALQLLQARDVRGAVIPASGHNIALENPAALAQAYLDFFAGG